MFAATDQSAKKKQFVENARLERERREKERIQKIQTEKETKAATTLQAWWRRKEQRKQSRATFQAWWNESIDTKDLSIMDFFQLIGTYCMRTKRSAPEPTQLRSIVKRLTLNKFKHPSSSPTANIPYYVLMIDMRYMTQACSYLEQIIVQCITRCTLSNDTSTFGPELTFLLQYLNPTTYKTKHVLDNNQVIDIPDKVLQSTAQSILKNTLCRFNLRDALILCVQHIVKLEDRRDTAKLNTYKLWLTTMTRLTLYPIEHAGLSTDALDMETASRFLWTNTLAVPCITSLINEMMADRLRKWALSAVAPYLLATETLPDDMHQLSGNGCLFLLANLVDLWNSDKNTLRSEEGSRMVEWVQSFLVYIQPYFAGRQSPLFPQYHPIFLWSNATWGNTLHTSIFDRVMNQLEYIWSRSFMDQIFQDIIVFDQKYNPRQNTSTNTAKNKLMFLKRSTSNYNQTTDGNIALFSMQVASIFSMYIQLTQLFKAQRKVILYRIAFTSRLMPQLWKLMNCFGPKGNMAIYLDAAKQNGIEKEPLVQVLQVFCEACSIVFLTLDDVDIFKQERPFSPNTLIQISSFLNQFYFWLIQQHTDVPTELPPAAERFKPARRLLLQIYDLDLHHPFCPPKHWLLISMNTGIKSFFSTLFSETNGSGNSNNSSPSASMFLANLKQGDPVPLRILQLMPHTVSFEMRLKIFREWIALDRYSTQYTSTRCISVRRTQVLEDAFAGLADLPHSAWKGTIKVSFVNELGMEEAGIDQGGPFKDFLTLMISEAFRPDYGLFCATKLNKFYPSFMSSVHGRHHIQLFELIGKAIGKAMYEGILLDVQFAGFILARLLGRNVFLEELKELDEEVWRNLTFIKHYEGDVEELCLTFEANEQVLGKLESHELKFRGKDIPVTNNNKIEYIYLMADYKLNQRAKDQTRAFIHGFRSVISENWIRLFSPPELQRVLSGEDKDFDVNDLRKHTIYDNGYFDHHPVIRLLWQIVSEFSSTEKRAFLKFVTGCPKPPLGGFDYLQPPFTVRMVSIENSNMDGTKLLKSFLKMNNNKAGRLPSSATCFNVLKLPAYTKKSLLKEKLCYAINNNTGFELS